MNTGSMVLQEKLAGDPRGVQRGHTVGFRNGDMPKLTSLTVSLMVLRPKFSIRSEWAQVQVVTCENSTHLLVKSINSGTSPK